MKMSITMAFIGGMAVAGIIYLVKNPEKFKIMKDMEIDAMNKMCNMIDDNN